MPSLAERPTLVPEVRDRPGSQSERARRRAEWDARKVAAATAPATPSIWVGEIGVCGVCEQLTQRGVCSECQSARALKRAAALAQLRPFAVLARRTGDAQDVHPDVAVLEVPDTASKSALEVARVIAHIASIRLMRGDTLDFALSKVAAGRDLIKKTFETLLGVTLDRKTVARALAELVELGVLKLEGQLEGWLDVKAEGGPKSKRGAFVYSLNICFRKLGTLGLKAVRRVADPINAAVRGAGHGRRLDGCLRAAVSYAQIGQRNSLGHWLACRCTDVGLSEGDAVQVLRLFHSQISDRRGFSVREVERTVRSRYLRTSRTGRAAQES